jgi:hypothetical protein
MLEKAEELSMTAKTQQAAPHAGSLISPSSILILSGFLVGMGLSDGSMPGRQCTAFLTAGCGLLSFYALDGIARRRIAHVTDRQTKIAVRRLENRIGRHIGSGDDDEDDDLSDSERQKRDMMLHAVMTHRQ